MSETMINLNTDNQILPRTSEEAADQAAASGAWDGEMNRAFSTEAIMKVASIKKDAYAPLGVDSSEQAIEHYAKVKR